MASAPKMRRKKKIDPCPNPLFVEWLTEWRDEAAAKGIKTQYAYGKALNALKKYPMPLPTGKSAKILDFFGDKICKMLDHKLEKYIEENGHPADPMASNNDDPFADFPDDDIDMMAFPTIPAPPRQAALPPQAAPVAVEKPKRKAANRAPREYVPVYRSGPYAIMLTLFRNHVKPGSRGYMSKTELQREAQPLSEKSFTLPDPGSRYTAWSSMGTLISKGYITKEGSPARYIITDAGCELAHKLEVVAEQYEMNQSTSPPPMNGRAPVIGGSSGSDSDTYRHNQSPDSLPALPTMPIPRTTVTDPHTISRAPDSLAYWYIDDRGHEVHSKDAAAVLIDEELSIGFLIKCDRTSLQQSAIRYKLDHTRSNSNTSQVYAYIHNDDAQEVCPVPSKQTTYNSSTRPTSTSTSQDSRQFSSHTISTSPSSTAASRLASMTGNSQDSTASSSSSKPYHKASSTNSYKPTYPISNSNRHTDDDSQYSMASVASTASTSSRTHSGVNGLRDPPKPIYVMKPGTFEIVLCVDSCETAGGAKHTRKDLLLPELQKNGVNLHVRKLQVGDFLWIAREKRVPVPGMLPMPTGKELVLDYVVERKRMDDLCSSIMDGRFHEQKFRLKQCGLHKPIYLVEEFGSIDHLSIPASALRQAAINTQVVNGFFVKFTRDQKESVAYLTIMTRYLQNYYSNKTLNAYQKDDLETLGKTDTDISSDVEDLLTFREFNECSMKNKDTTVFETFAKQLLQISGLSAEKAVAITNAYRTLADLLDAYGTCALEKDREKLLAHIKFGATKRNLGPALSKTIYKLYCTEGRLK